MTTDEILVYEIGKRAPLFGGWGARLAAKSLPTETRSASLTLAVSAGNAFAHAQRILQQLGRLLEVEQPALRAIIGAGSMNLNPAVVDLMIKEEAPAHCLLNINASAKEGMIKQQTAAKAIQRVTEELLKHIA